MHCTCWEILIAGSAHRFVTQPRQAIRRLPSCLSHKHNRVAANSNTILHAEKLQ